MTQRVPAQSAAGDEPRSSWIRSVAGLVVAGFAGALNFIGLKSAELSTVLRNDPHGAEWLAALISTAIVLAIASVFVPVESKVSVRSTAALAVALVVPISLSVARIQGETPSHVEERLACVIAGAATVTAIALFSTRWRPIDTTTGGVTTQGLLVVAAILLSVSATYTGLRLETFSQQDATAIQLGPIVTENGTTAQLNLHIGATRLRAFDRARVTVWGLLRGTDLTTFCTMYNHKLEENLHVKASGLRAFPPCSDNPCYEAIYLAGDGSGDPVPGCENLSIGTYLPDAAGSITQELALPTSADRYQRLEVIGQLCRAHTRYNCTLDDERPPTFVAVQLESSALEGR
jgi:hypothetical protein